MKRGTVYKIDEIFPKKQISLAIVRTWKQNVRALNKVNSKA